MLLQNLVQFNSIPNMSTHLRFERLWVYNIFISYVCAPNEYTLHYQYLFHYVDVCKIINVNSFQNEIDSLKRKNITNYIPLLGKCKMCMRWAYTCEMKFEVCFTFHFVIILSVDFFFCAAVGPFLLFLSVSVPQKKRFLCEHTRKME